MLNSAILSNSVPGRAYYSREYSHGTRIFSFAHQIQAVLSFEPRSVLEVGAGAGVVTAALRAAGPQVTTLDVQSELSPDLLASVTAIPAPDKSFDIALCSQVLEHLPFNEFRIALRELRRVASIALVLSLPDVTRYWGFSLCLPLIGQRRLFQSLGYFMKPEFPSSRLEVMGHHWEIGYRGYGLRKIIADANSVGWALMTTWRVPEVPWHRFFTFRPE